MQAALLGPAYTQQQIAATIHRYNATAEFVTDLPALSARVSQLLAAGKVIGWFQDRMEFGPRALGNRSILADPRNTGMQQYINLQIKAREAFRPFAPSVLEEDAAAYFDMQVPSPYMLFVTPLKTALRFPVPANYQQNIYERLSFPRSSVPAVTHVDYSARIQTVNKTTHPKYWQLIHDFKALTGCPMLINTSFNVRGEPIVCTPEDAFLAFMHTAIDYLVMGNYLLERAKQTAVQNIPAPEYMAD
jgi:carbamoyltransferase